MLVDCSAMVLSGTNRDPASFYEIHLLQIYVELYQLVGAFPHVAFAVIGVAPAKKVDFVIIRNRSVLLCAFYGDVLIC